MQAISSIQRNIDQVKERIIRAAQSVGRDPGNVGLVIVTKAQPVEVIRSVLAAGAQILGENYPEETVVKMAQLEKPASVSWHMIGHLQSRKSGLVVQHFDVLESLDSVKLAERLERLLVEANRDLPVMLEFNVGGEESKNGWSAYLESDWEKLLPDVEKILSLDRLKIRGVMTMPPFFDSPEKSRPYFVRLRKLGDFLASRFGADFFSEYSMGTSVDFETAVQEGATFVRVGQAIVGPRLKIV